MPPTDPVLEALLTSPLAVAVIDRDLRLIAVNAALARLIECEPPAIVGATVREAAPPLAQQPEPALRRVLDEGIAINNLELPVSVAEPGRVCCRCATRAA
jgi:PAS domain-containing protein